MGTAGTPGATVIGAGRGRVVVAGAFVCGVVGWVGVGWVGVGGVGTLGDGAAPAIAGQEASITATAATPTVARRPRVERRPEGVGVRPVVERSWCGEVGRMAVNLWLFDGGDPEPCADALP
ncbi:MAG: hypothetical protein M3063_09745 [Actinomycetota bacterium]|nr:hypothetical protein [Actinomycetota bacterium]